EGLIIAFAGAAAGIALSFAMIRGVVTLAARDIPRADQISLDARVLLFALAVAIASCVIFSLAPLWQARRIAPRDVLADGGRSSAGSRSRGLFRTFVISEIALA